MARNIYAYTAPGLEPEFISINREDDGRITIHVRGPAKAGGGRADQAQMTLPVEQLASLYQEAYRAARQVKPRPKGL